MVLESVSMDHGIMPAGVCLFALFLLLGVKINNQLCLWRKQTRRETPFISGGFRQSSFGARLVGAILPFPTIRFYGRGSALVCLDTAWMGVDVAVE